MFKIIGVVRSNVTTLWLYEFSQAAASIGNSQTGGNVAAFTYSFAYSGKIRGK